MSQYALPQKLKLSNPQDFKAVFTESTKITGQAVIMLIKPNHRTFGRLGIVIAKRKVKRAVARVWLKRIIRETFRLHQSYIVGFDVVVLARQHISQIDKTIIRDTLIQQWKKVPHTVKKSCSI